ncbi:hypothetical protein ACJJTC_011225 [Scirpophaga incertulas]
MEILIDYGTLHSFDRLSIIGVNRKTRSGSCAVGKSCASYPGRAGYERSFHWWRNRRNPLTARCVIVSDRLLSIDNTIDYFVTFTAVNCARRICVSVSDLPQSPVPAQLRRRREQCRADARADRPTDGRNDLCNVFHRHPTGCAALRRS